jgi:hypothetical protein
MSFLRPVRRRRNETPETLAGWFAIPEAPKAMAANTVAAEAAIERLRDASHPPALCAASADKRQSASGCFFFAFPHLVDLFDLRFEPETLGPVDEVLISSNDSRRSRN